MRCTRCIKHIDKEAGLFQGKPLCLECFVAEKTKFVTENIATVETYERMRREGF